MAFKGKHLLAGELDAVGRQGLCLVCLDSDTNTLIRPCNHVVLCSVCANSLTMCPLDRRPISARERVYLNTF
jgi:hypothetical protein